MKKNIIIDGSSILSSCYYATLPKSILFAKTDEEKEAHYSEIMQSSSGEYTNGVYGSLRFINKIIKLNNPEYLSVVFDMSRNTFRRELYPDYKGQRGTTPSPLKHQFILLQNALKEIGVTIFMDQKYEADDFAASIVKQFESPDIKTVVITKDRDYLQLPSEYTECWLMSNATVVENLIKKYPGSNRDGVPMNLFAYSPDIVKKETGVWPLQFAELKALIGDSSDHYPGVKGISSAAIPLLQYYNSIDGIYEAIRNCGNDDIKLKELASFWKTNLNIPRNPIPYLIKTSDTDIVGEKAAMLFKVIATMKDDINLGFDISDMVCRWSETEVKKVCSKLDIKSL